MANRADIAEMKPVLELTLGPCSLECAGTLNSQTKRHVLEAVEVVLEGKPSRIDVDISALRIADADGANALVAMQRMVRMAGVQLHWRGIDAQHVSDGIAL